MAAGCGHFKGTLDVFLPPHVGKVKGAVLLAGVELATGVDFDGAEAVPAVEESDDLSQRHGAVDGQTVDHAGLAHVLVRHDEPLVARPAGHDGDGERSTNRAQRPVEPEFAHKHVAPEPAGLDVVVGAQQAEGERQVVGGAFFAHVGGGEVDDGVAQGQPEACVAQGGLHAGAAFAHSAVGEADHEEVFSDGCAYFDLNGSGFEAVDGGTEHADQAVGCFGHGGRVFFYRARRSPSAL